MLNNTFFNTINTILTPYNNPDQREAGEICPICTELSDNSSIGCRCPCVANYHYKCINQWLGNLEHFTCPYCKTPTSELESKPNNIVGISLLICEYANIPDAKTQGILSKELGEEWYEEYTFICNNGYSGIYYLPKDLYIYFFEKEDLYYTEYGHNKKFFYELEQITYTESNPWLISRFRGDINLPLCNLACDEEIYELINIFSIRRWTNSRWTNYRQRFDLGFDLEEFKERQTKIEREYNMIRVYYFDSLNSSF